MVEEADRKDEGETNISYNDRYNKANAFRLLSNINTSVTDYSEYHRVDSDDEYNNPAGDKENDLDQWVGII